MECGPGDTYYSQSESARTLSIIVMLMAKMVQNGPPKKLKIFISQQKLHSKLQELPCSVHRHTEDRERWVSQELRCIFFFFFFLRGLAHSKMNLTPQFKHQTVAGNPEQCTDSSNLDNYLLMSIYSQSPCPPLAAIALCKS